MSSLDNALVKRASSLHQRKYRERDGAFLAEGADIVATGLALGFVPQQVFLTEGSPACGQAGAGGPYATLPVHVVTAGVAARISTLEKAPEVTAVFCAPPAPPLARMRSPELLVLYADRIADPGNLGTLVRAAAGFGATAVVASPETVDLLSPKVVRAGMGAVFCLPLYQSVPLATLLECVGPARVCGLVAHGGRRLPGAAIGPPAIVCVGSERAGLSGEVEALLTDRLTIPLESGPAAMVESLNAGVAGAIALYEFSRRPGGAAEDQRRLRASEEG